MADFADGHLHGTPSAGDEVRWQELLDQLDAAHLAEVFVDRLSSVPGYDPSPFPRAELYRTGKLSFEALIQGLRSGGIPESLAVADDVGVSRARAKTPLTSLMTAIRLDFAVLWEELTRVAQTSDAELVIRHTGIVLETVDDYASQTQRAYAAEKQRMLDEATSVRQGLIAALFEGPPPPERLSSMAADLGVRADEPLTVVAATGEDVAALRLLVSEASRAGANVYTHHLSDTLVAFTRETAPRGSRGEQILSQLRSMRVGVETADGGLADLHQAGTRARDLALLLAPEETGAMTWSRGWARLAAHHLAASGHGIMSDVHRALAECGAAEQQRLEESVRSYLRTGSISASAAALFCHRNTLANRLKRFTDLTDVDPTVPEQAARLVVGWA